MISIILAEDQGMLLGALGTLLSLEDDFEVIGKAKNGEEALTLVTELRPDVCVMDIEMPIYSGLEIAEKIKQQSIPTKVIILTTFARPGYIQRALSAGVYGFLLKDGPSDELADTIRDVHKGKRVISPELSFSVWEEQNPLNQREIDVLGYVESGLSSKEIAKTLFLSDGTVRNYMSEILSKLGAKNRVEAVHIAKTKGWL